VQWPLVGPLTPYEILLGVWILNLVLDEMVELVDGSSEHVRYFESSYNIYDLASQVLLVVAGAMRCALTQVELDGEFYYEAAAQHAEYQVMLPTLALANVLLFLRNLEPVTFNQRIGVLIVSVYRMMPSFAVWGLIMLLAIVGFGFSFAVLTPAAESRFGVGGSFWIGWWAMLGDFEHFEYTADATTVVVPFHATFADWFLYAYTLGSTVVMVNLLIAMFADDYSAMKDTWAYNQKLVFSRATAVNLDAVPFPAPLSLPFHVLRLLLWLRSYNPATEASRSRPDSAGVSGKGSNAPSRTSSKPKSQVSFDGDAPSKASWHSRGLSRDGSCGTSESSGSRSKEHSALLRGLQRESLECQAAARYLRQPTLAAR